MSFILDPAAKKKGYFLAQGLIPRKLVELGKEGTQEIVSKALRGDIKNVRVYRDYPYIFGGVNVWGVEHPHHSSIESEKFNEFIRELDLERKVLEISGWDKTVCSLFRIHTASPFWKYQGTWHRDAVVGSQDSIHLNLYLDDEEGFRIVPIERDPIITEQAIDEKLLAGSDNIELERSFYDELSCRKGDILFFRSFLLHQGTYCGRRRHVHMCFKNANDSSALNEVRALNINFMNKYDPTGDIFPSKNMYTKTYSIKSTLQRSIRLLNYFIPCFRLYRERKLLLKLIKSPIMKYSLRSNTMWQV